MFDSSKQKAIADLTTRLKLSDDRLKEAIRALAPRPTGNERAEYEAANEENLRLQRELAQLKEMPVAYPLEGVPQWDVGAPMPHVLSSGYRTILLYYVQAIDPNWDGSYVKIRSTSSEEVSRIAVVEFHHCYAYKFGGPNDEALDGHPLWNSGLEPYSAHRIENSLWKKEEMQINSVHSQFDPEHWQNRKHFLFLFHDELFECIAGGFSISVQSGPFSDIAQAAFTTVFTDYPPHIPLASLALPAHPTPRWLIRHSKSKKRCACNTAILAALCLLRSISISLWRFWRTGSPMHSSIRSLN